MRIMAAAAFNRLKLGRKYSNLCRVSSVAAKPVEIWFFGLNFTVVAKIRTILYSAKKKWFASNLLIVEGYFHVFFLENYRWFLKTV